MDASSSSSRRYYFELNLRTVCVVFVAGIAALLGYFSPSHEELQPVATHGSLFPARFVAKSPFGDSVFAKDAAESDGFYAFGRWKTPVGNVTFHTDAASDTRLSRWKAATFQTKWWHYSSINTRDYFIGMAIVKVCASAATRCALRVKCSSELIAVCIFVCVR